MAVNQCDLHWNTLFTLSSHASVYIERHNYGISYFKLKECINNFKGRCIIYFNAQISDNLWILFSIVVHSSNFFKLNLICMCAKWLQSCVTLCDPMDCSQPGSSVHAIRQARITEWDAISFSRGSSQPWDQTCISYISCLGRWVL